MNIPYSSMESSRSVQHHEQIASTHLAHPQLGDASLGLGLADASQFVDPELHDASYQVSGAFLHREQDQNHEQQHNAHNAGHLQAHSHNSVHGGQFGTLTPLQHDPMGRLQHPNSISGAYGIPGAPPGTLSPAPAPAPVAAAPDAVPEADNTEVEAPTSNDPPNLELWRKKLFNVNEEITLSEHEYLTYFPHVDNVYSHRSTQPHKKQPCISYYWDCRLKGRPPGTKKSDDPLKKKRKRTARLRDQCDVKIKITEFFALESGQSAGHNGSSQGSQFVDQQAGGQHFVGIPQRKDLPADHPGVNGAKYYTIQRVNGNGGNGKGDGVGGGHRHTLQYSDAIKRNSVQRSQLRRRKEIKKLQKSMHKKATGAALATVKRHSAPKEFTFHGNCVDSFSQRLWIALEAKRVDYSYREMDLQKKSESPVPTIDFGEFKCGNSVVLMEYLEDLNLGPLFLPGDVQLRAHCRYWSNHINRHIVPAFYNLLVAQDQHKQEEYTMKLRSEISKLVEAADPGGPFFLGNVLGYVDIQLAPFVVRMSRVLKPHRGWADPAPGSRWATWVNAIESNEHVQNTTSTDDVYLDSYEGLATGRQGTAYLAEYE